MEFEPHTFAIIPLTQSIIYLFYEVFNQFFYPAGYTRELVKLEDGGTLGLDWDQGIPDPNEHPSKPILIMVPGVAGDSQNMYQLALALHVG